MISFNLTEKQEAQFNKWFKRHKRKCPTRSRMKALGIQSYDNLVYTFRPTGIGDVVQITCDCGTTLDLTDTSTW